MNFFNRFSDWVKKTKFQNCFLHILILIFILRIIFAFEMGLMPQDAYYYFYSQNPALSYFDHPPGIAVLLGFFTMLFGKHVFVIKIANTVCTLLTIVAFHALSKLILNSDKAQNATILFFSTFMVSILSLVSTPDVPLMLFWTLSMIAIYKAINKSKLVYWILAGLLMGLSFDSKYTGLFLPLGLTIYLIFSVKNRHYFASPKYYLAITVFFLTISPVIYWNYLNHFASFKFQTSQRAADISGISFHSKDLFGLVGHQSAILVPILFLGILFFLIKRLIEFKKLKSKTISEPTLFLFSFFLPLFCFFVTLSNVYWVKLNWIMPAYIAGIIWVAQYFTYKWIRYQVVFSFFIHLILAVEVYCYAFPIRSDDTWYGWQELSDEVGKIQAKYPNSFVFTDDGYKTSAVLDFYLEIPIYHPNIIGKPGLQLDIMPHNFSLLKGKDAILIDSDPHFKNELKSIETNYAVRKYFSRIEQLSPILIKHNGLTVRKFFVYHCKNYQPNLLK